MVEIPIQKSKIVGISMLLLSLLLTTTVAALIYLAVSNSHEACSSAASAVKEPEEVTVKATISMKSEEETVSTNLHNFFMFSN